MSTRHRTPTPPVLSAKQAQQLAVLSLDQYKRLEAELSPPVVSQQTTELMAGQLIGIQLVLKKLRDGFVIGT
jgi:hypothetical protein